MKTIEEAIQAASTCLKDVGVEDPRLESEFLLAAFLHISRTRVILDRHQALPSVQISAFQAWLQERQKRKPLAYVSGEQPFRDLNLKVTPDVLIPRPETELLVEQALRVLDAWNTSAIVVDVGTGSGNIALSLAAHPKVRHVVGIDASKEALVVARHNERNIKRGLAVEWLWGNLLAPLQKRRIRPDLIVANLPYIRTDVMPTLEPELHWEPRLALEGGDDGLRLIAPCIAQAAELLKPGGVLLLEIGADQSQAVMAILAQSAVWADRRIFIDLAGHPRILQARRKEM
jgi:release factor glutamine methyltransferase